MIEVYVDSRAGWREGIKGAVQMNGKYERVDGGAEFS